jgi:hypothetical protein
VVTEVRTEDAFLKREDHPAYKRGADELMNRCEYALLPRAKKGARRVYLKACLALYAYLNRHFRRRP